MAVIIEVEMILNCRPLSYVSSEDYEEPLTPSHLLCGHRIMSLQDNRSSEAEDSDTDVQPQDLDRRMRHLSNVMNHFWKRWRKEYLLELRNSHRNVTQHSSNRVVSIGDVVIVHDEDQPRGKWCIGKLKLLSQDQMVTSEEPLFELKLRQEDSLDSDVQYNAFTP